PFHTTITVADYASSDATHDIGGRLAADIEGVRYMRISDPGRGRAIAAAWLIIRGDVARRLVPQVEDRDGFFDTELLVLAERAGLRIHEVPIEWDVTPDVAPSLREVAGV